MIWTREPVPGGAAYRFAVDTSWDAYNFSFAVDPDLGSDAADDVSGFDVENEMVYVLDEGNAIGVLLRAAGSDAFSTVTQVGASHLAPMTGRELLDVQRSSGVRLTGNGDVQLVLSALPSSGRTEYEIVILRATNLMDLRTLASNWN